MAAGLQVLDADGVTVMFDSSWRPTQIIGEASTGTSDGSLSYNAALDGRNVWFAIKSFATDPENVWDGYEIPHWKCENGVISWSWDAVWEGAFADMSTRASITFIYGVY